MRNIEIKASIQDWEAITSKAEKLSGNEATVIKQTDTFFKVQKGRLKLRQFQVSKPAFNKSKAFLKSCETCSLYLEIFSVWVIFQDNKMQLSLRTRICGAGALSKLHITLNFF